MKKYLENEENINKLQLFPQAPLQLTFYWQSEEMLLYSDTVNPE